MNQAQVRVQVQGRICFVEPPVLPPSQGLWDPGQGKRPDLLLENMDVPVFLSTDESGVNVD